MGWSRREPTLSVIVPALNEEANIAATLNSIFEGAATPRRSLEVLVVDGGSTDATRRVAQRAGARVLRAQRGRGSQLNAGWQAARGDICLFLHADTRLPAGYQQQVQQLLGVATEETGASPPQAAQRPPWALWHQPMQQPHLWGCFSSIQATELPGWQARLLRSGVELRTRLLRLPFGDQAIFARRSALQAAGGLPEWGLFEDVNLVQRLNRLSPPVIIGRPVITSGRRWTKLGFLQTTLTNQALLAAYAVGVPPQRLAAWYYGGASKGQ